MILRNELGDFHIAPQGHVMLWEHNNDVLSACPEGFRSANDPAFGGLFAPAWHHYRDNGESDIWRKGWEINPLQSFEQTHHSDGNRFETVYYDLYGPVVKTSHRYDVSTTSLRCTVTFTTLVAGGPAAYLKEPKIVVGLAGEYTSASGMDAQGKVLQKHDLTKVNDPARHTIQLRNTLRSTVRFDPGSVTITARTGVGRWTPSKRGLDGWAQLANTRKRFSEEPQGRYCQQGPDGSLTRNWEIIKRGKDQVALLLHGWEGGTGLPDCLGCARAYGPPGETFANVITVTKA